MSTLARLIGGFMSRVRRGARVPERASPNTEAVNALFQQCVAYAGEGRFEAARDGYLRLLEIDPGHAKARNNLGVLHQRAGDFAGAGRCFEEAASIDPRLAEPHVNLGNLLDIQGDPDAAASCYRRALEIDPGYVHAHCCLAQALLATGCYEQGWQEFEWRWRIGDPALALPPLSRPMWDGSQEIAGKRMLIYAEQGYGDAIQFIRYAPLVADRGARVIAVCDPALSRLFRGVAGVESVAEPGTPLPEFDYHAPLMSLPRAFGTTVETIPATVPYIAPDRAAIEAWRSRLGAHPGRLRIGLAWAGRPTFVAASMKACPLDRLAPLLDVPDCEFVSLQKGEAAAELRQPGPWSGKVTDLTAELRDFSDTAALIGALDLVISIDTAAAHLAGALGKPVWLLLAAHPDWRWLPRGGAARWYPTARLFRQRVDGDWTSVVSAAVRALREGAGGGAA